MTHNISKRIATFFYKKGIIPHQAIDSYAYGYEILLISLINWGTLALLMFVTNTVIETLLYVFSFSILRHHTGGYHATSHLKCFILTLIAYLSMLFSTNIIFNNNHLPVILIIIIISFITILHLSPIDHPNKPVSAQKLHFHRIYSILISIIFSVIILLLFNLCLYPHSISILSALLHVSISLSAGMYIKRKEVSK